MDRSASASRAVGRRAALTDLATGAAAVALLCLRSPARAEAWPAHPVVMVTGYAPGGVTDLATRAVAQRMERELGQPIVVENKPGGGTSWPPTSSNGAAAVFRNDH